MHISGLVAKEPHAQRILRFLRTLRGGEIQQDHDDSAVIKSINSSSIQEQKPPTPIRIPRSDDDILLPHYLKCMHLSTGDA